MFREANSPPSNFRTQREGNQGMDAECEQYRQGEAPHQPKGIQSTLGKGGGDETEYSNRSEAENEVGDL